MSRAADIITGLARAAGSRLAPRLRGPGGPGRLRDLARVATGGHGAVDAFAGTPCATEQRTGEAEAQAGGGGDPAAGPELGG
jgi:hypothetical protein